MADRAEPENPQRSTNSPARLMADAMHVFISYATQDAGVADAVVRELERMGLKCWIAPRDVVPGALYADEIVRAIDNAKVVVLVMSESAIASAHVGKEVERASSKRRRIVVLRTDSAPLTRALEYFLSESHWIEVRSEGVQTATARLSDAIQRHLDPSTAVGVAGLVDSGSGKRDEPLPRAKWLIVGAVAIVSIALALVVSQPLWRSSHAKTGQQGAASGNAATGAGAEVSDRPQAHTVPAPSIAVLPFADLSPEKNQQYFSDGVAEEILNVLAKIDGLKVASRTSSFQFRNKDIGTPLIAKELGVRHVLEGSVRKAGDTVRITAQLIDADTDAHLWSQTFDRPLTTKTIFAVQDEIANAVLKAMNVMLQGKATIEQISAAPPTNDKDAYDLYLRAHQLFTNRGQGLRDAVLLYERAVQLDPKFARAWAGLAAAAGTAPTWDVADRDYKTIALSAAEHSIALDPNQALPYAVQGNIAREFEFPPRYEFALEKYAKALSLAPKDPVILDYRAQFSFDVGDIRGARGFLQQCLEADPAYFNCRANLSLAEMANGDIEKALSDYESVVVKGFSPDEPNLLRPLLTRGERFGASLVAFAVAKDTLLADALIKALEEKSPETQLQSLVRLNARAASKSALKDYLILQIALAQPVTDYDLIIRSGESLWFPDYAAYRKTADFKKLVTALGLPAYWRKHGWGDFCKPVGQSDFECR
jgi:adenylate cyclase